MSVHKFKVGQSVKYASGVLRRFGSVGDFRIVQLLPAQGDEWQYRIKSTAEPHERVVRESELDMPRH